ncbi:MAG: MaoC family dehydratase N-terminal domain-containing protein, partial [Tateyamaria sp.]
MQSAKTDVMRQSDVMDPARANAMQVALGRAPELRAGDPLPPFFHQLYFWSPEPPESLGRDGHPKVGGVIPDMGLPRRMWAGGRLSFHAPVRVGVAAEKMTLCEDAVRKEGRTGPLAFVTLRHEIWQEGALCAAEWQDLVLREDPDTHAPRPGAAGAPPTEDPAGCHSLYAPLVCRDAAL